MPLWKCALGWSVEADSVLNSPSYPNPFQIDTKKSEHMDVLAAAATEMEVILDATAVDEAKEKPRLGCATPETQYLEEGIAISRGMGVDGFFAHVVVEKPSKGGKEKDKFGPVRFGPDALEKARADMQELLKPPETGGKALPGHTCVYYDSAGDRYRTLVYRRGIKYKGEWHTGDGALERAVADRDRIKADETPEAVVGVPVEEAPRLRSAEVGCEWTELTRTPREAELVERARAAAAARAAEPEVHKQIQIVKELELAWHQRCASGRHEALSRSLVEAVRQLTRLQDAAEAKQRLRAQFDVRAEGLRLRDEERKRKREQKEEEWREKKRAGKAKAPAPAPPPLRRPTMEERTAQSAKALGLKAGDLTGTMPRAQEREVARHFADTDFGKELGDAVERLLGSSVDDLATLSEEERREEDRRRMPPPPRVKQEPEDAPPPPEKEPPLPPLLLRRPPAEEEPPPPATEQEVLPPAPAPGHTNICVAWVNRFDSVDGDPVRGVLTLEGPEPGTGKSLVQHRVLRFVPDVLDWRGRADKSDELKLSDIETPPHPDPYNNSQTLCIWVKSENRLSVAGLRWYVLVCTQGGGLRGKFKRGMQRPKAAETYAERRAWWDRAEATGDAALRKKFEKIGDSVKKCMASIGIALPYDTRRGDTLSFDCDAGSFTHVAYSNYHERMSNTMPIEVAPALWKMWFRAHNVKIIKRAPPPPPPNVVIRMCLPAMIKNGDRISFDTDVQRHTYTVSLLAPDTVPVPSGPGLPDTHMHAVRVPAAGAYAGRAGPFLARNIVLLASERPPAPAPPNQPGPSSLNQPGPSSGDSDDDVVEVGERTREQRDVELRKNAIDLTDD